jgi:hypothetical protein
MPRRDHERLHELMRALPSGTPKFKRDPEQSRAGRVSFARCACFCPPAPSVPQRPASAPPDAGFLLARSDCRGCQFVNARWLSAEVNAARPLIISGRSLSPSCGGLFFGRVGEARGRPRRSIASSSNVCIVNIRGIDRCVGIRQLERSAPANVRLVTVSALGPKMEPNRSYWSQLRQ